MLIREITELVDSTSDSAFAADDSGHVVAWNRAAEAMFGISAADAMGKMCGEIVQGMDECGPVCSADCTVQQAVRKHQPRWQLRHDALLATQRRLLRNPPRNPSVSPIPKAAPTDCQGLCLM